MQHQTLPGGRDLTFETVVPRMTSTRHVAAAAFYHCLGASIFLFREHHKSPMPSLKNVLAH
jgi:hypothetical protein